MTPNNYLQNIKALNYSNSELNGHEYSSFINTQDCINFLADSGSFFFVFLDLSNMTYQYVSPSINSILGYPSSIFMEKGIEFLLSLYHPDTVLTQKAIHEEISSFIASKPIKEKGIYKYSFDLHIKHANGCYIHLLQHNKILKFSKTGQPLLMFIQCQNISNYSEHPKHTIIITRLKKNIEEVVFKKDFYPYYENKILTSKETEVWRYISDGLSSKDIAVQLNISLNTVLTHRKRIYKKIKALNN